MILQPTKCSVDMIEFSKIISPHSFEKVVKPILSKYELSPNYKYWEDFRWNMYRHNWTWTYGIYINDVMIDTYTFYFGYKSNLGKTDSHNKFRLKYNPNKVPPDDLLLCDLLYIFKSGRYQGKGQPTNITWIDFAFDYDDIRTSSLILDKGLKRRWSMHKFGNGSDYTYYIGNSGTNGSIKIYDKAHEETNGRATYNRTRYELTIKDSIPLHNVSSWKCTSDIPEMHLNGIERLQDYIHLSPTDKILMYAVEHDFPLEKLTYEQKRKYKTLSEQRIDLHTKIAPSQPLIEKALHDFVTKLFY